jgi:hemerythrin-like domain-containing protein
MLTATYALMTLSVEQKKERSFVSRILHYLQANAAQPDRIDPVQLKSQLDELTRFAEARHKHKLEVCIIPAVREASADAAPLLADLDSLSRTGSKMLRTLRRRLRLAFAHGSVHIHGLCRTMQRYCENVLARLAKEEQELLPLAQRVVSSERWFTIGTTFLSDEAGYVERSRPAQMPA